MARVRIIFRSAKKKREFPLCQHGWNGGPARVERRTSTGGTADQHRWNGGPERVERRTRTGGTADHEGGTADRQV